MRSATAELAAREAEDGPGWRADDTDTPPHTSTCQPRPVARAPAIIISATTSIISTCNPRSQAARRRRRRGKRSLPRGRRRRASSHAAPPRRPSYPSLAPSLSDNLLLCQHGAGRSAGGVGGKAQLRGRQLQRARRQPRAVPLVCGRVCTEAAFSSNLRPSATWLRPYSPAHTIARCTRCRRTPQAVVPGSQPLNPSARQPAHPPAPPARAERPAAAPASWRAARRRARAAVRPARPAPARSSAGGASG
jgi:hypothetical protein